MLNHPQLKNTVGRQCVLVDSGVLQLVRNVLQRSAERGNQNHLEVLDELTKTTFSIPENIRQKLFNLEEVISPINTSGETPVITLDVDFKGIEVQYRISKLHEGVQNLTHGKYELILKK